MAEIKERRKNTDLNSNGHYLDGQGFLLRDRRHNAVSHPSHYTQGNIECIDAIQASMSASEFAAFLKGNVQKYLWRYSNKNGIEDLKKAQWYLNKMIEVNV